MHGDTLDDKGKRARLEESKRVRTLIYEWGLTLLDIDRKYRLPRGTAGTTLREPNLAGEKAIAKAVKVKAFELWPSRYHSNGRRKSPQPSENYERLTSQDRSRLAQAQKGAA